jgi:predicted O-methyltransferase YrrM
MRHRDEFPVLFKEMGYKVGVEVGTFHGNFAEIIARGWGGKLFCVDAWKHLEGYVDIANKADEEFEAIYRGAQARLNPLGVTLIRKLSVEGANDFKDGGIDWVYLDADHSREAVEADLNAWWSKVRSGGIVAGHDYFDGVFNVGVFGVKSAVDEFLSQRGMVAMTTDLAWNANEGNASWYVLKP